jgi:hypothetical protein
VGLAGGGVSGVADVSFISSSISCSKSSPEGAGGLRVGRG